MHIPFFYKTGSSCFVMQKMSHKWILMHYFSYLFYDDYYAMLYDSRIAITVIRHKE